MTDRVQESKQAWKVQTVRIMGENQRAIGHSYRDTAPTTADEYEFRASALLEAADALRRKADPLEQKILAIIAWTCFFIAGFVTGAWWQSGH